MTCDGCVRAVERRLKSLPGVRSVKVNLRANSAEVDHDADITTPAELSAAVSKLGYTSQVK
jgi:copper chaperone CopZ